jgi:hypothetical protein
MATTLAGCTSFGAVKPREYITAKRPPTVWLWKADSSVVMMRGPHFVAGDTTTLIGMVGGDYAEIPLAEVQQMKTDRPAPERTLLLVVGGVGAVVGGAMLVAGVGSGTEPASSLKEGLP